MSFSNKTGNKFALSVIPAVVAIYSSVGASTALAWDPVLDAFTTTAKVKLNFRSRYEDVTDDNPAKKDAEAATLRSRITYETGTVEDFSLLLEMDDVTALMPTDYDDGVNTGAGHSRAAKAKYTAIQDPEGTEVNQAALSYTGLQGTVVKWGRQKLVLDNERFIGSVAWRQNEQTFDAVSLVNKSLPKTTLTYANINNVNRIVGEDTPSGDHEHDTHILNAKYEGIPGLALSAYGYLLDNQDMDNWSSDTYGLRAMGKQAFGDYTLKYTLEYAMQQDAGSNPTDYDADYYLGEIGFGKSILSATLGYEVLGADDGAKVYQTGAKTLASFQTTLATLHKFQGWADQYLGGGTGNIDQGIEDAYVVLESNAMGMTWGVNYHIYETNVTTAAKPVEDLGTEWGASVEKKFDNYSVGLKYASYTADDSDKLATKIYDKDKVWVTLQAQF